MAIYNLKRDKLDPRDHMVSAVLAKPTKVLPVAHDLRNKCPEVYDQGQLGSCSANAGCTALNFATKDFGMRFSRLYLYFEERKKEGTITEDSGASMRDICKVATKGVAQEQFMPYIISKFTETPSEVAYKDAATHKAAHYHAVKGLTEIKQIIAFQELPVLIGMDVFDSFESEYTARTGIVTIPKAGEQFLGGHAVLIVGYDDNRQCLIVRNSWGSNWGDRGYFYLPYEFYNKQYAFDAWVLS
ncbi:MAG TPA: C1 family peptidase [Pseudoneobacillus sp.]|nr:C1 family peptidase [Pseudoneobacillus sp.]